MKTNGCEMCDHSGRINGKKCMFCKDQAMIDFNLYVRFDYLSNMYRGRVVCEENNTEFQFAFLDRKHLCEYLLTAIRTIRGTRKVRVDK